MKNNVKGSLCCAGCVINVGFSYLMTNLAGLLCVPLMTKLGCAYTDIAMIWTTLSLGAVIARAFQGQLYDKFNPKIVTLLGAFSYIFGLCGLAFVKTPMQAVLLYVLVEQQLLRLSALCSSRLQMDRCGSRNHRRPDRCFRRHHHHLYFSSCCQNGQYCRL